MKEYTLIYCVASDKKFLIVEKDRPAWQKGKLNLPGGKVEPGETSLQAANRELLEETGLWSTPKPTDKHIRDNMDVSYLQELGQITGTDDPMASGNTFIVHCFWCATAYSSKFKLKPRDEETEKVYWIDWVDAQKDRRLMPNLRAIIPLMMAGQNGWSIVDNDGGLGKDVHTITLNLPGDNCFI